MILSERHARLRAHDDQEAVVVANDFVRENFGGDFERAAWFLDEVALMQRISQDRNQLYSIRNGRVKWHSLRSKS